MDAIYKTYLHRPPHLFMPDTVYIVTGGVLGRRPVLKGDRHKAIFCEALFGRSEELGWLLEAWAVLGNHYHFIARSPGDALSLVTLIRKLHSITAILFNRLDGTPGRRVWQNYWDSCVTNETSYLARLHYVHLNPVKHGVVERAEDYPFCSYRWFLDRAETEWQVRVMSQPIDRIRVVEVL
jgi:putative transposase